MMYPRVTWLLMSLPIAGASAVGLRAAIHGYPASQIYLAMGVTGMFLLIVPAISMLLENIIGVKR